jgi:hypothetical protein
VQAEHLRLPAPPCRGQRRRIHDDRSVSSQSILPLSQCPALPVGSAIASGTILAMMLWCSLCVLLLASCYNSIKMPD